MNKERATIMRLLQFTDSAFPIGTFSFSNGLETASYEGLVTNADSLEDYIRCISRQAAFSDGIACLHAFRSILKNDYEAILEADKQLIRFKMNEESRLMLTRMGKKMTELCIHFIDAPLLNRWLTDIQNGLTPGCYPIAQGIIFALCGLTEEELFLSHQYGVINMVLSASLRCIKVSHYDTQKILFNMNVESENLFNEVKLLEMEDMNAFVPQIDILSSLHEKGKMRMFMN